MNKLKKKIMKFSSSIPAVIEKVTEVEGSPHLSSATLKVFHLGETNDGRKFSAEFVQHIAATIGGTPIVAKYIEDKDDFEGHAGTQSVFGFVPEDAKVEFVEDENKRTWLQTEVRLFTQREDVGTIAKKIVGKGQSLELDPETVQVSYQKQDDGSMVAIFEKADLIGLSVLGADQVPAFQGSEFFSEIKLEKEALKYIISRYTSFSKDNVIEIEFDDIAEGANTIVAPLTPGPTEEPEGEPEPEIPVGEPETPAGEPGIEGGDGVAPAAASIEGDGEGATDPGAGEGDAGDAGAANLESQNDEGSDNEETNEVGTETQENESFQASLDNEEREELNRFRRKAKEELLGEFLELLDEEEIAAAREEMDNFTLEEFEAKLSVTAMKKVRKEGFAKKENKTNPSSSGTFMLAGIVGKTIQRGDLQEIIDRNK